MSSTCIVIGAGLAGSECALTLADRGVHVVVYEQRPLAIAPAHHSDKLAELVCSNSLKSEKLTTAAGLLKWELKQMGSHLLSIAYETRVKAGGALAVDRHLFAERVTQTVEKHPNITLIRREIRDIPSDYCVIAAGPLCSDALFEALLTKLGAGSLSFYDAAAPIIDAYSIDMNYAFSQSRYQKQDDGDYLNCPMEKAEYLRFVEELTKAKRTIVHDFESKDLFNACQPVEEIARSGVDTLAHGALKPVGILDPKTGKRPYANVQLRAENSDKTAYNLVGFQTNLTWEEQKRVFRLIPGLQNAEFLRFGVMHRNSFVDSPHVLDGSFAVPNTKLRLAGQITGTEGYTEAIASGLIAGLNTYADMYNYPRVNLPSTGALGSLIAYATNPATNNYQPMHVQFGLMPALNKQVKKKDERRRLLVERAQKDFLHYLGTRPELFIENQGL